MPKFAQIDNSTPPVVIGYYDTDAINYPSLPSSLVELSDADWLRRMDQPTWNVIGGALVAIVPPPLTIQQQALVLLANPVVTVSCASDSSLNADYSADAVTRGNITGIAVAINGGLGLPGGGSSFNYPDAIGIPHHWPADKFILFAQAVMNYVYHLSQVAGGHEMSLPSSTLSIA